MKTLAALPSKNPVVERLFEGIQNPVFRQSFEQAVRFARNAPLHVEALPEELLVPALLLGALGAEYNARMIDDMAKLRERIHEEIGWPESSLARQLLEGATFTGATRTYSEAARANCAPGEVQVQFLPIGTRFKCGPKTGILEDKNNCRAMVRWFGNKVEREIHTRDGASTTILVEKGGAPSLCLDCPVEPLSSVISKGESEWLFNAWKELTGAFDEPAKKGGAR